MRLVEKTICNDSKIQTISKKMQKPKLPTTKRLNSNSLKKQCTNVEPPKNIQTVSESQSNEIDHTTPIINSKETIRPLSQILLFQTKVCEQNQRQQSLAEAQQQMWNKYSDETIKSDMIEETHESTPEVSKEPTVTSSYYFGKIAGSFQGEGTNVQRNLFRSTHFFQTFAGLVTPQKSKGILPKIVTERKTNKNRITLVFDLDETLTHCNLQTSINSDVILKVKSRECEYDAPIHIRPHAREVLKRLSQNFEIVVFTASQQSYADEVLNMLDPQNEIISLRLFRESCILTEQNFYIKDLSVLCNELTGRRISDTVLIDNSSQCMITHIDNGIPILSFFDDRTDTELLDLEEYVELLHNFEDVRDANRTLLGLHRFFNPEGLDAVFQEILGVSNTQIRLSNDQPRQE